MLMRTVVWLLLIVIPMSANAMGDSLRVETEWLKDNLGMEKLVILDVRLMADYEIEHIPGAISFPDHLTYQQKSVGGRIVEPDIIQGLLRERGVDKENIVIVYDDGKLIDAARVFWALEVYGLKNVKVLNKGYAGWVKRNYPVTDKVEKVNASQYVPVVDHRRIASKFSTQLASVNPMHTVIDARPTTAYRGETSSAKRFGHIPRAINIPVHSNIASSDDGQSLKGPNELESLYDEIPRDGKVILYCEVGKASATNYLALRELGYDVANYDASWREWGNDFNLPIEK